MKSFLLGTVALMALGTAANAADLSPKTYTKAPPLASAPSWTGFYLFGGGGYGLLETDVASASPAPYYSERQGGRGYFGTVGGGYDWQFNTSWVAGIFADAQFGDIKGTIDLFDNYYSGSSKNKASYAAGARLGYLIAPNALSYVNAGYSHADFSAATLLYYGGGATYQVPKRSYDGWFIGGGVENSLDIFGMSAPGWFMKTEYRVAEYSRDTTSASLISGFSISPISAKPYVQTVSTSLVYRFDWNGAPAKVASTPVYTKAPAAAPFNWSGVYLAGGAGYGQWSADEQTLYEGAAYVPTRSGGRGYFGTVGGGYDYQFTRSWVAGLFADAQFGDIKGTFNAYPSYYGGTTKNKTNYAAGVRVGYLVAPNVLSYVNVGYSHADFTGTNFYFNEYNLTKQHYDGWFVGGGVENSLNLFGVSAPGWFIKTEYRLAEYDGKNIGINYSTGTPYPNWSMSFKPYVQTVSTSLVYRFNSGGH